MAKTSYQLIPDGLGVSYDKAIATADRFTIPRVRMQTAFLSRSRKKGILQSSLIIQLAPEWQLLSDDDKDAWNSAGAVSGMTGFKLFVKDYAGRIANGLTGHAVPNDIYQVRVGRILIASPATSILIEQIHPRNYWVMRKVHGTRSQYEPVYITENFAPPVDIQISYKTDLTEVGGDAKVRFYARIFSSYQGTDLETDVEILFGLSDDWQVATASSAKIVGVVTGYIVQIEARNVQGNIYFDNVIVGHSGHNWMRDGGCNDIHQDFTKAFFQIPKHWAAVDLPTGAFFESVYYI